MKTFETEKGNIPEGATHYRNECSERFFMWIRMIGDSIELYTEEAGYLPASWLSEFKFISKIKPIPQTKEVEWVNGDACRYANDIDHDYIYIGEHPHGDGYYIFSEEKGITYIANGYLLEPETEAERKERKDREKGIHELSMGIMSNVKVNNGSVSDYRHDIAVYIYDSGYRKGE